MTFMSSARICATADMAFRAAKPGHSENDPRAWLGPDAAWEERRLFDWTYVALELEHSGLYIEAAYARSRADAFRW